MEVLGQKDGAKGRLSNSAILCTSCERDGDQHPADGFCHNCQEYLCKSCRKYHKKSKLSTTHAVVDLSAMPNVKASPVPRKPSGCTILCPRHHDKMLEFLCQQHNVVVCYVCSITDHSLCTKDYIPDISENYAKGADASRKVRRLKAMKSYCTKTKTSAKDTEMQFASLCDKTLCDIDKFRKEINATLDRLQTAIMKEVTDAKKSNANNTLKIEETCASVDSRVTSILSRMGDLQSTGQHDCFLVELLQADIEINSCEDELKQLQWTELMTSIELSKSDEIQKCLKTATGFGKLLKCTSSPEEYNVPTGKCSFERNVNIKTKEDRSRCEITGMTEISADKFLLVDYGNKAVKILNTSTSTVTERLELSSQPFEVTALPDIHQAAVTLTAEKTIQFLSTDAGLSKVRTMNTNGSCQGIAYGRGKLVVTYDDIGKYEILSLNGDVVFTSSPELGFGETLWHTAVSQDEHLIFISDIDNNRVIKLTWDDGKVVGEYKEQTYPRALVTCADDSFYVCSYGTDTIHHVTADCKRMNVVVREGKIKRPQALCYNTNDGRLFVSCWVYDDTYDNDLKVYKLE